MAKRNTNQKGSLPKSAQNTESVIVENHVPETPMGELEKVRSILFGEQLRVYEERIAELEAGVANSVAEMRRLLDERMQSIEQTLNERLDSLSTRMEAEQADRKQLESLVTGDFKDLNAQLEKNQADLQTQLGQFVQQLTIEQKESADSLQEKITALSETLSTTRQEKMNRTHLAQLLTQIAQDIDREESS